jgi:hypothetical protein
MKGACAMLVLLAVLSAAFAQEKKEAPPQGLQGKTMESCKADIEKYCAKDHLKQECLVAHWTRISSDCQDGLATPMRGGGD